MPVTLAKSVLLLVVGKQEDQENCASSWTVCNRRHSRIEQFIVDHVTICFYECIIIILSASKGGNKNVAEQVDIIISDNRNGKGPK